MEKYNIIKRIAKGTLENKITIAIYLLLAMFAIVMPSDNIVINILTCIIVCLSAFIYANEEIKIND